MNRLVLIFVGILVLMIGIYGSAYIVQEGRQAIVTQFGRPIGNPVTNPGLHFKLPFIQDVRYMDKRILEWDGDPNQIPTKDKKFIFVDTTARWRITNALKFIETVQNETGARAKLDGILDAATRDAISGYRLVEAVRNTNSILRKLEEKKKEKEEAKTKAKGKAKAGALLLLDDEEEVVGEIEPVVVGREALSQRIVESAGKKLEEFGIKLIDVQLRRIAYEKSVEKSVYERMISERKRIAEKIRSVGKGEQAKIQGKTSRDLQRIRSEAYRTAQVVRGKAEAQAIAIYARALNKDPNFYDFIRKMEAYKKALRSDTDFILSTDSEFLNRLRK